MPELRWILLGIGLLLLVAIYVFGRMSARKSAPPSTTPRVEPSIGHVAENLQSATAAVEAEAAVKEATADRVGDDVDSVEVPVLTGHEPQPFYNQGDLPLAGSETAEQTESDSEPRDEKVVAIHVAARGNRRFHGPDLQTAFASENLEFGEFQIFHRHTGNRSVFSISSMVEPGTFDPESIESFSTPGLSLFMVIPGPESPVGAFTEMLSTARRLATILDGEVLDESGSTLSRQAAAHMREQIIEFAHRVR